MIIPNLCCSIRIEPGKMYCVSVVVPHPSYLPEKNWKRVEDPIGMLVVDCHTIALMKKYGYCVHRQGDVIISVEIDCEESGFKQYMRTVSKHETPETKEPELEEIEEESELKEAEKMLKTLDITDVNYVD